MVAKDPKKYVPLASKNPTLDAKGNTLCGIVAKKVSSWFVSPADLALLNELVKDFDLRSLPFYVILDDEWRFVKYGAKEPSRGLEKELFRIQDLIRGKNKTKVGEK